MKKRFLLIALSSVFATVAVAQDFAIPNAVTFTRTSEKTPPAAQKEEKKQEVVIEAPKIDRRAIFEKTIKHMPLMEDPRFVKKGYGRLRGIQESIKEVQQERLDEKKYPDAKAKEQALKEMQDNTLIRFEDSQDKPEDLNNKINQDPRKAFIEMAESIKYPDEKQMTPERAEVIQKQAETEFQDTHGMTMQEYKDAFDEQVKVTVQQQEEEKSDTFPVLKTDKEVKVEKVDDQNALLHVSVKAPKSKKE